MEYLVTLLRVFVTEVAAWITGFRMRRRVRRALGTKVADGELYSINTWIRVYSAEQRNKRIEPIHPK